MGYIDSDSIIGVYILILGSLANVIIFCSGCANRALRHNIWINIVITLFMCATVGVPPTLLSFLALSIFYLVGISIIFDEIYIANEERKRNDDTYTRRD